MTTFSWHLPGQTQTAWSCWRLLNSQGCPSLEFGGDCWIETMVHTGGEGLWKPEITLWIHWKLWSNLLSPLPPDTIWEQCYFAICPTCVHKITFHMFPGLFFKCSQHVPKMSQCSQHVPTRHMLEIFWEHFGQPYWMLWVVTCWSNGKITLKCF